MSLAQVREGAGQPLARDVLMGREPDILADIGLPGVAAAIWTRSATPGFQSWIDSLPADKLPELRTVIPVHLAEAAARAACERAGLEPSEELDRLVGDIGALALMCAKSLDARQIRLRLDVSDEVMCPKFHVDNVPARLLCTYRGAGTDYVPLGQEAQSNRIRQVRPHAAALFRGGAWPGAERTGLLHRSPDPQGAARLLLVIDPVE